MPIEIPIQTNQKKVLKFLSTTAKILGWTLWIGLIIYFFYKAHQTNNTYSVLIGGVLTGSLISALYKKFKKIPN